MTYNPMYSRQRADFVAAVTADAQPLVDAAEATRPTPAGRRFDGLTDAADLRRLILSEFVRCVVGRLAPVLPPSPGGAQSPAAGAKPRK